MLQVRAKDKASAELFTFARQVIEALSRDCRVIINDRFDIAMALGAAGVHLGEDDLPVSEVRRCVPKNFIIGATCRDPAAACRAEKEGADYLGVGAVFPTGSKNDTRLIGLEGLAEVCTSVKLPVYGIAGITPDNCSQVVEAGAYGCAGITAVTTGRNPEKTYRRLEETLENARRPIS
jgi:thiamine-phosphate pyrophosphorylase